MQSDIGACIIRSESAGFKYLHETGYGPLPLKSPRVSSLRKDNTLLVLGVFRCVLVMIDCSNSAELYRL